MKHCGCSTNPDTQTQSSNNSLAQLAQTYLCFHKDCAGVFHCLDCQEHHRPHSQHYFSLETGLQMLEELLNKLRRNGTDKICEVVEILQKFKLMEDFKTCIDRKWKDIENELLTFLNATEDLIHQYTSNKKRVESHIDGIDEGSYSPVKLYEQYKFNRRGQNLELKDQVLKETEKQWQLIMNSLMAHESQLKDYSIKMVEIVTDEDLYQDNGKVSHKQLAKYAKLHEEIKNKLKSNEDEAVVDKVNSCDSTEEETEGQTTERAEEKNHSKKSTVEKPMVTKKKQSKKRAQSKLILQKLLQAFKIQNP